MNLGFWAKLKSPFFILAPMEDVTDTVFRQIIVGCGRPDVFFSEFTSAEGICSEGFNEVAYRLRFNESERPIVAQIWGITPQAHEKAARIIRKMGFDGIDINMGCPVNKIIKHGACSALIKNPLLAAEIVAGTKEGAKDLPVSVKTRIGFNEITTEEWIGFLLEQKLAALTVHGRIAIEMSKKPANWNEIARAVDLRDQGNHETLIIGNGDVKSLADAREKVARSAVDGVMIGRGVFDNPWLFNKNIDPVSVTPQMRTELLIQHLKLFNETWGNEKNFDIMKKFFKIYISGFKGAAGIRNDLMKCRNYEEAVGIITRMDKSTTL